MRWGPEPFITSKHPSNLSRANRQCTGRWSCQSRVLSSASNLGKAVRGRSLPILRLY